VSGLNFYFKV